MDYSAIELNKDSIIDIFAHSEEKCEIILHDGMLCINDYVVFPVFDVDSSTQLDEDISLVDDSGREVGMLCPLRLNGFPYDINALTVSKLICMINDVDVNTYGTSVQHFFKNHYLLVSKDFSQEYKEKYYKSSAIWGGFTHEEKPVRYDRNRTEIKLVDSISIPTPRHEIDLRRAVSSASGFERFLKYYHQLELLFDVIFVFKIKALSTDSLNGYGDLIKDYQKKELENIKSMLKEYVDDMGGLLSYIASSFSNADQMVMISIFQDHTKEGNPLMSKGENKWQDFNNFINAGVLDLASAKACRITTVKTGLEFDNFLAGLFSYWIYRIRCSIAHSKIGEFIFDDEHEEFVVDFGEVLIKEVISRIFSNAKLKSIL